MANDLSGTLLFAGFVDPVAEAQRCFRALLNAMARPGSVHPAHGVAAPAPLCAAAGAVLLTLVDPETRLWLDPAAHAASGWLAFHTGAPLEASAERAAFAMALTWPDLAALPTGTDEVPEASATLILQVASLSSGRRLRLSGPGLRRPAILSVAGLPADFAAIWTANHALFPRGVDLILCAGEQLAALPRSVHVEDA